MKPRRSAAESDLSLNRVRALLAYDRKTGRLMWKVSHGNRRAGQVAGSRHSQGYVQVRLDGHVVLAHRLIVFVVKGEWPEHEVDHRDGKRTNNRWRNLRPATSGENKQNACIRRDSRSGLLGVGWHSSRQEWRARIRVNNREKHLGWFKSRLSAHRAYLKAKREMHLFQPIPRG